MYRLLSAVSFLPTLCCLLQTFSNARLTRDIAVKAVGFYPPSLLLPNQPHIEYDLRVTFNPTNYSKNNVGYIEVLTYNYKYQKYFAGELTNLCIPEHQQGVLLSKDIQLEFRWAAEFTAHDQLKVLKGKTNINGKGLYITTIVSCLYTKSKKGALQLNKQANYVLSGHIGYYNPWGHLPGQSAPLLAFYALNCMVLGIFLCVMVLVFALNYGKKRAHLRQYHLFALMLLFLLENMCVFLEYYYYNFDGVWPNATVVGHLSLNILRRTTSRMMILGLVYGYCVYHPMHNANAKAIGLFGIFYSIMACLDVIFWTQENLPLILTLIMFIVQAVTDLFHIVWVMRTLRRTIQTLVAAQRTAHRVEKKMMYESLWRSLWVYIIWATFVLVIDGSMRLVPNYKLVFWRHLWSVAASWYLIFTVMLCHFAFMWRPAKAELFIFEKLPPVMPSTRLSAMPGVVNQVFGQRPPPGQRENNGADPVGTEGPRTALMGTSPPAPLQRASDSAVFLSPPESPATPQMRATRPLLDASPQDNPLVTSMGKQVDFPDSDDEVEVIVESDDDAW